MYLNLRGYKRWRWSNRIYDFILLKSNNFFDRFTLFYTKIKHKYVPGYTPLVNLSHYYVNNRVGVVHERSKATEKLREPY